MAVATNRAIMRMTDICYTYGSGEKEVLALKNINLEIHPGEFIAITGPSGSGKSTLMQVMGCMLTPTSGTYYLMNDKVSSLEKDRLAEIRNRSLGFIFQSFNLMSRTSAEYNVSIPLIFAGVGKKKRLKLARQALAKVGLEKRASHFPSELSGGEQQRVAIARAIVTQPAILLADEPTGNLDQKTGRVIMELFKEMVDDGMTVIYVTHDLNLEKMASRSIQLVDARLV